MNRDRFESTIQGWMDNQKEQEIAIYPVEHKAVSFNGAELLGIKANNGKVYVGVRWVCDGLGLREGQRNNQLSKIQSDIVLKQGVRKFILPTKSGEQEVLVLELDFLPIWLAKISPNTLEGEAKENLVQYQLKAKDVLAAAFLSNVFKPEDLSPEIRAIFIHDEKLQVMDGRIGKLENTMTIDYGQQRSLRKLGNTVVMDLVGGKNSVAYKKFASKAFNELWKHYKNTFNIESYCDTPSIEFERGKEVLRAWKPSEELRYAILGANTEQLVSN
ncbi:phage antirepressor N-terminal domain-containing protein [Paenibacillus alvei]|uniref:phage antirepressor N-terminal domain-containing protein n=1 Tax=Paenibacillus alvei TaxID=44250 RepID=UPI0002891E17|nr:phage antirepressor N-terminal domain-containing protein [Paenibacillus alvei]EJW14779.1 hypothetical protein PAV_11c01200 [Paenibacillus alvei DSM 29]MCY9544115.1 ORF6C domain-containing protein [Paenibacillus alvei]MCY9708605.1 ORF6C domain-containing protein [Paenibacillus alvei]MEC0083169.1 phage antirepressor N-terminal domain-containing protein [Paenibacillus alvei]NEZ44915.1 hypothetical protein [Paenibacillus alvei]